MQGREWGFLQQIVGKVSRSCPGQPALQGHRALISNTGNPWHKAAAGPSSSVEMKAHITTGHLTLESASKENEQV